MLRDNLVELIEPMRNSAGAGLLALGICRAETASDDSLSCLENPRPEGAESSLTDNVTSPFQAEPRHAFVISYLRIASGLTATPRGAEDSRFPDAPGDWSLNSP